MAGLLRGKVAKLIDTYTVALNIGKDKGVEKGMKFAILCPTLKIEDPDTHEELGELNFIKARIEVTEIFDRFCLAESSETIVEALLPFPSFYAGPRAATKKLTSSPELDKTIRVGDDVEQILEKPKSS